MALTAMWIVVVLAIGREHARRSEDRPQGAVAAEPVLS
jgi:hypothetical protein